MCCHALRENIVVAGLLSNLCFSFSSLIFFRFVLFLKSLHSSAGYCHFLYITSSTILCHWTLGIDCVVTSVLCVRLCLNASISPFPLLPPALPFIPHHSHQSLLHACMYSCAQDRVSIYCYLCICSQGWPLGTWQAVSVLFSGEHKSPTPYFPQSPAILCVGLRPQGFPWCSLACLLVSSVGGHVGEALQWSSWHY